LKFHSRRACAPSRQDGRKDAFSFIAAEKSRLKKGCKPNAHSPFIYRKNLVLPAFSRKKQTTQAQ
jgi:hypothetical protein